MMSMYSSMDESSTLKQLLITSVVDLNDSNINW